MIAVDNASFKNLQPAVVDCDYDDDIIYANGFDSFNASKISGF
jgi:hypothetical protein